MSVIDLRSDTVTQPDTAMRRAMADAEVGDDVFGEDPTVNRLQERAAEIFGTEGALFVASGTMANQIAVMVHCRRGDEVLVGESAHVLLHEAAAVSAVSGVLATVIGQGGFFTPDDVRLAIHGEAYWEPRSALVWFENTHNASGGRVFPRATLEAAARAAREHGLATHIDGARILNACAASATEPADWARAVDSLSFCLSKGLGCPVGSVLLGRAACIDAARRLRRMLGGAMRQAGVLAAAGLYALEHRWPRLAEDHEKARALARGLAALPHLRLHPEEVETNIVLFELDATAPDTRSFVAAAAREGLRMAAVGPRRVRAVTHADVSPRDMDRAIEIVARVLETESPRPA